LGEETEEMLAALEKVAIEEKTRWTPDREIAATTAELLHQLIVVNLKVAGLKRAIKPLHIERPWDKDEAKVRQVQIGFGQFARMIGAGRG